MQDSPRVGQQSQRFVPKEAPTTMKKALVLTSLAALAAVSFGCVLTDYGFANMPVQNKSHGLIGCTTDDRFANTQQTSEAYTREFIRASSFNTGCSALNTPVYSLDQIDAQTAREWERFIATWTFFGEVINSGVPNGTWVTAGLKDLADGSLRINNLYSPDAPISAPVFSCVGDGVDGRYGGPEGVVVGDGYSGRVPNLRVACVVIDSNAGTEFCQNIAAVSPLVASQGDGWYSTYWGLLGRAYEGRLAFTPITRRAADMAAFLAGGEQSVTVEGVTISARGQLNADGTWTISLLGLRNDLASYQAVGQPLTITVNPANGFKTRLIQHSTPETMAALADFAIQGGLVNREIVLPAQVEGINLPNASFMISEAACRALIENAANPGDGFGG